MLTVFFSVWVLIKVYLFSAKTYPSDIDGIDTSQTYKSPVLKIFV